MQIQLTKPHYFDQFHCIAQACHHSCCVDWDIWVSKNEYSQYRATRGVSKELSGLFRTGVRRYKGDMPDHQYAHFILDDKQRCPMLQEDGLCKIQIECGEHALTRTCQLFPREGVLFNGLLELSCSTGCEEVVRILLNLPEGLQFTHKTLDSIQPMRSQITKSYSNDSVLERPALGLYSDVRNLCIRILQSRSCPLEDRILILGMALKKLDAAEKENRVSDFPSIISQFGALAQDGSLAQSFSKITPNYTMQMANAYRLSTFSTISLTYKKIKEEIHHDLGIISAEDGQATLPLDGYLCGLKALKELLNGREYFLENVMVNYIFQMRFPFQEEKLGIWEHYLLLCSFYNYLYFMMAGGMLKEATEARLLETVALASRYFLHTSSENREQIVTILHENASDAFAHMAILVKK